MRRFRQAGTAAFFFFLGKGLLWLLIPGIIVMWNQFRDGSNQ